MTVFARKRKTPSIKKVVDNRKKNTKRHLSQEIFDECLKRDGGCIICMSGDILAHNTVNDLDRPHHAYYGLEQEFGEDRNDVSKLVTICRTHHHRLHFGGGNDYREFCKTYLKNIYGNSSKASNAS